MKYGIVVLANSMPLFEMMCASYPQELKNEKFDLVVVNETRIGDKTERIKSIVKKYDIKNYKCITDKEINAKVKEKIVDVPFVDECFFTMNILPLWYLFNFDEYEKVLLLDDDVILQKGISSLFLSQKSMFQPYFLNLGSAKYDQLDNFGLKMHETFMDIANLPKTKEFHDNVFKNNYINGGNRFVVKSQYKNDIYEQALLKFFTSDFITDFWHSGKSPYSGNLDERFESAVFYEMGIIDSGLKKVVKHLWMSPDRLSDKQIRNCKKALIIHYSMNSRKLDFIKRCMRIGYLPYVKDVYEAQVVQNRTDRKTTNFTLNSD